MPPVRKGHFLFSSCRSPRSRKNHGSCNDDRPVSAPAPERHAPPRGAPEPHPYPDTVGRTNRQPGRENPAGGASGTAADTGRRPAPGTGPPRGYPRDGGRGTLQRRCGFRRNSGGFWGGRHRSCGPCAWTRPRWDCVYLTPRRPGEVSESQSIKVCRATLLGNCDEQMTAPVSSLRPGALRTGRPARGSAVTGRCENQARLGRHGCRRRGLYRRRRGSPAQAEPFRAREREGRTQTRYPGCLVRPRTLYRLPGHRIRFAGPVLSVYQTTSPCNCDEHYRPPRHARAGQGPTDRR